MPLEPTLADVLFPKRDVRFGTVVGRLSETENGPAADNFVSNEDSYPRVVGELKREAPKGGVYLGVGPDQNFTFLAACAPRLGFIVDFRRRNMLLHLLQKALINLSADRIAYLTRLTSRVPGPLPQTPSTNELVAAFTSVPLDRERLHASIDDVRAVLRPFDLLNDEDWRLLATIQSRLAGPGLEARFLALKMYPTLGQLIRTPDREGGPAHWLATEASYQVVRGLQLGDRLLPIVGDFGGEGRLKKLRSWLVEHQQEISVFYISDVEFFLLRNARFETYVEALSSLPWHGQAVLIRSSTREIKHPERFGGDSTTTIVRRVSTFLKAAHSGKIQTVDDLFAAR